jgi:hypothetical protein
MMKKNHLLILVILSLILLSSTTLTLAQDGGILTCDNGFLQESYTSIPHEIVKTAEVIPETILTVEATYTNNNRDVKIEMMFIDGAGNVIEEVLMRNFAFLRHTFDAADTVTIMIRPWNIKQSNVSLDIQYDDMCPPRPPILNITE